MKLKTTKNTFRGSFEALLRMSRKLCTPKITVHMYKRYLQTSNSDNPRIICGFNLCECNPRIVQ